MNKAFRLFGWGLLFVAVDFRLVFVDILPDIIGYAMIWSAIVQLGAVYRDYRKALPFAATLTFLSLGEWYPGFVNTDITQLSVSINAMIYGTIMQFLLLLLLHYFLLAIASQARDGGAPDLAAGADGRRLYYSIVTAVTLIALPFAVQGPSGFIVPMAFLTAIMGFIALLLILFFCFRAATAMPLEKG